MRSRVLANIAAGLTASQSDALLGVRCGYSAMVATEDGYGAIANSNRIAYNKRKDAQRHAEAAARRNTLRDRLGIDPRQQIKQLRDDGLAPRQGFRR